MTLSVKARLTVLYFSIFGVTLLFCSILLYQSFTKNHLEAFDSALYNYAVDISHSLEIDFFGGVDVSSDLLKEAEKIFPFSLGEAIIQLKNLNGNIVASSNRFTNKPLPFHTEEIPQLYNKKNFVLHSYAGSVLGLSSKKRYRIVDYLIDRPGPDDFVLQVAAPMVLLDQEEKGLMTFFLLFIPVSLVFAAFAGYFLSIRAFKPVNAIIANVESISAHELSKRVPIPEAKDEIHHLAVTLNSVLDRLEQAFQSQESFIANASHQLKTPLSIIRGELDLLLKSMKKEDAHAVTIESVSQEIDHLSRLVEELLVLARVDAGVAALTIRETRLDELLLESVSRLEKLSKQKQIQLNLNLKTEENHKNDFMCKCDPDLIRSMFENILENAIKYSPASSTVSIKIIDNTQTLAVHIKDQGPGLTAKEQEKLFQRFSRTPGQHLPGTGLGLSIARKIAEVHQGSIELAPQGDLGSEFKITLPKNITY